jgi:tripartite-type tricarboxylate transporter receptor subunit TctC
VVSSPGLPSDRTKILREAYAKTLQDPELQEEAKKRGWELRPVGGEELQALAKEVSTAPAEVIERMKKLMGQ